jgi:hypothetical protein
MKTPFGFRGWSLFGATLALWLLAGGAVSAQAQAVKPRLGIYDSRAIAVAYANSAEFRDTLKAAQGDYQQAKADKDEKKATEIGAKMKLMQRRMHEQGFSTGSVAGIMSKIKDKLPGVAKEAGVQAILSKWELNYQSADIEVVDVTDAVVALFRVSDKGKEWIKGVRAQPPVPMEQITDDLD